jgi:hypothetical protein
MFSLLQPAVPGTQLRKLELVNNCEAGVVFPQAGFAITDEVAKAAA